jgi:hypothetical protein
MTLLVSLRRKNKTVFKAGDHQIYTKLLQLSRTPRVSPKAFDQYQVKDALLAILAGNEEPPTTMEEVAKRLCQITKVY